MDMGKIVLKLMHTSATTTASNFVSVKISGIVAGLFLFWY